MKQNKSPNSAYNLNKPKTLGTIANTYLCRNGYKIPYNIFTRPTTKTAHTKKLSSLLTKEHWLFKLLKKSVISDSCIPWGRPISCLESRKPFPEIHIHIHTNPQHRNWGT
jgi:hypothetical protein